MRYLIVLLLGVLMGATLFVAGLYYNPFAEQVTVSPLAVSAEEQLAFTYSAVPAESILYTDNGKSIVKTHPERVAELFEPTLVDTHIMVTLLDDNRGDLMGLGIKFSSKSEETAVIHSEALVNSVWHVYLPRQGTMLIDQVENFWPYLRDIVVPARWSSGDSWRGSFFSIMTQGPGALGTARASGGSGKFEGLSGEAVESLTARAYSTVEGPLSMYGSLTIILPATVGRQD